VVENGKPHQESGHVQSFITASSLAEEYIEAVVQITKDGIPVIYPHWFLPFDDLSVSLSSVTFAQAKHIFVNAKGDNKWNAYHSILSNEAKKPTSQELSGLVYDTLLTLEEFLHTLPSSMGVCIVLKYPTTSQKNHFQFSNLPEIQNYVESVLKLVYEYSSSHRSIIFSSFNPCICSVMNWKQPNYGVFFATKAGYRSQEGPWRELYTGFKESDIRCNSIKEAVKFAKSSNLLGLVCEASPLIQAPVLIQTIKESGLILASYGKENEEMSNVKKQEMAGVDAIVTRRVLRYNIS
jgi:CDK inhibitor PHO81